MRMLPRLDPQRDMADEELVAWLAAGHQEALGPLYTRYAGLIFNLATQSLDRPTAEEIVQDVFLTVWRRIETFDTQRGDFRPWLLQIAHHRVLNELRRRSRRPQEAFELPEQGPGELADGDPLPDEMAWQGERDGAVRHAMGELPPIQRRALDLAFFQELTHQQVASTLHVPLGTAKSRIRSGLLTMRGKLAPIVAAAALISSVIGLGLRYQSEQATLARDERALVLVTSSDTQAIRVTAPDPNVATHGTYRGRDGSPIALMTYSFFGPAPAGQTYQAWVQHDSVWTSLGTFQPDANGSARLIAEGSAYSTLPDAIEVTLEPSAGSAAPGGPVVIAWPAS
jgi:RNA polymerase sigma factor (sigma-70 family)